jgi:F-type H+-transporting ATPase subunit epsilon
MAEATTRTSLQLSILSPEKNLFSGEVSSLVVPGETGSFGIYPNHSSLVGSLGVGIIEFTKKDGSVKKLVVDGGFIEVRKGIVNILADGADTADSIDLDLLNAHLKEIENLPASAEKVKEIKKAKTRILLKQN